MSASKAIVRQPAPAFTGKAVINNDFQNISLADYKGQWVILAFIPMAWTFVCPTEIIAFNDSIEDFKSRGVNVIYASTDSEFTLLKWAQTPRKQGGLGKLSIPLLSDKTHKIARDYGVLIEDEADGDVGVALRGLFLIDPKGTLRHITINDLPVGRSVDEAIRLVDGFQFTEEHGEVCPANWSAGKKTMKADPVGSKEYFESVNADEQ